MLIERKTLFGLMSTEVDAKLEKFISQASSWMRSQDDKLGSIMEKLAVYETGNKFHTHTLSQHTGRISMLEEKLHQLEIDNARFSNFERDIKNMNRTFDVMCEDLKSFTDKVKSNSTMTSVISNIAMMAAGALVVKIVGMGV